MNKAADIFTDSMLETWRKTDFEDTWAAGGLANEDLDSLKALCVEHGCDLDQSVEQVMRFIHTRVPQTYRLELNDEAGGDEEEEFEAGTERQAVKRAIDRAEEWAKGGDWGIEGARVSVYWVLYNENGEEVDRDSLEVDIEPDHDALIRAAGGDPDCEHKWTGEGEGGCDQNPGVWSTGGTSLLIVRHCEKCGLKRKEHWLGAQRNPREHDTFEYEQPEKWCEECQSEECDCDEG